MGNEKFSAVMGLIIPKVIELITKKHDCDELTATNAFYRSGVYAVLEEEGTKLWHLSPHALFQMFDEEKTTGSFTFPEGV